MNVRWMCCDSMPPACERGEGQSVYCAASSQATVKQRDICQLMVAMQVVSAQVVTVVLLALGVTVVIGCPLSSLQSSS